MVKAYEMAKPFGENSNDYLRTQQKIGLTEALSAKRKCVLTDLVKVLKGLKSNLYTDY